MEKFLRSWRQDALNRGQHDSAIYIGDKVLALTNSDSDAFWLAQVHFSNNNYTRALALLSRKDLISRSTACRYLAAHCYIKQNQFEQALSILGDHNPTHLIRTSNNGHSRRKLQHLNGQSHVTLRNGKTATSRMDRAEAEREDASQIRFEAAMCYLRGLCFAKQNAFDRARDCYKDAVRIDVQCFEAFDQLMKNSLMSPAEELEFLESLDFDAITASDPSVAQEAAHFTKMLYTTRLSKYSSPAILSDATETLSTHYNLAENPDILLSRAEAMYTQCRFAEALELTSSILSAAQPSSTSLSAATTPYNPAQNHLGHPPAVYPLHLACLYETGATNALFLLSHTLADHAPEEPYTYLAIGVYYLSVSKIAEARRFFSKASLLDPHSAAAWIGFAHTFAAEGEHDQAIAAYSTAARLFQGSHLPQLFLGMQHLALNNMSLAHEYLCAAYSMSTGATSGAVLSIPTNPSGELSQLGGDPLVLNEFGVVLYHQNHLEDAVVLFRQALSLAGSLNCEPGAWVATRANMGHALRRIGRLTEALVEFDECLRVGAAGASFGYSPFLGGSGGNAAGMASTGVGGYEDRGLIGSLHSARGIILLELNRTMEAVTALHEAVRVLGASGGGDAAGGAGIAGTLLTRALEIWSDEGHDADEAQAEESAARSSNRSSRDKGKSKVSSRRRVPAEESYPDEWTDEVSHVDSQQGGTIGAGPFDEKVEMELDEDADVMIHQAMRRVKGTKTRRRLEFSPDVVDVSSSVHETPVADDNYNGGGGGHRRRGSRNIRSARQ
ncbi:anaphase promoting complex subunit CDC16 [Aspergillus candidus]|uniref:Anaphase-promoting complex, Cdc16 subunit n=1 Tax=Aspergillus candidus TaxID=41067 RepID=A0A2I2FNR9_ASPCN|nr:anaphase-promoting complex, Cdc16 subunit [Aspergillus candidus]PLB42259.1 anaphase-promoting complex, Cdc16 subunit [Aspergillus candidus]